MSEQALWLLGPAVQPRGPLPLLARRVVRPLARRRLRRPRVHRRRRGHARRTPSRPLLLDDTRLGAEVHAIEQRRRRRRRPLPRRGRDAERRSTADECIVTVPFVLLRHMEITGLDVEKWFTIRNVYYGRAHKIFMQFSRRWWVEDYADHPRRHGHRPRDPERRLHARPGRTRRSARACSSPPTPGSRTRWRTACSTSRSASPQALEDLAKIHPRRAETFEFGISHDWALDRHGGGIGPLFRPLEMTSRFYDDVVRPVGRLWFANDACDRRGAALDRGRHRGRGQERLRHQRRDARRAARGRSEGSDERPVERGASPGRTRVTKPAGSTPVILGTVDRGPGRLRAQDREARRGHRRRHGRARRGVRAQAPGPPMSSSSRRRTASAGGSTRCAASRPGLYAEAGGDAHPARARPDARATAGCSACRCARS